MDDKKHLEPMRHSLAHIMAAAIKILWPEAKFGVGPVVEDGFYYDVDLGENSLSEDDFPRIEAEMSKIISENQSFEKFELPIDEAIEWAKKENQPYKQELLNDLKRDGTTAASEIDSSELGIESENDSKVDKVSFYKNGDFTDLCKGPHVESTGKVGKFKLLRVSGAYWRGKSDNPQMQRVYGAAFDTQEELDAYLKRVELAKQNDHRVLGEKLGLFFMSEEVGSGLPLLTPRGERIKYELMRYMRDKEEARGYQYVATPVLASSKLYELSGHASYYTENMYVTEADEEGNKFYIKPMNCPHHHMIFSKMVKSYRDLPLRLSEHAGLYRYELSGTLTGLIRVRGPITQNDSHIYVTPEQVEAEFIDVLNLFEEVYRELNIKDYWFRLSLPDFNKRKYIGSKEKWEFATQIIRDSLNKTNSRFVEVSDEAAFYGPKLDAQIYNVSGKEDTIATVQLDIVVPERMDITYVDSNGDKQFPLVIHKSIMGAFERFMAFLIEQTAGNLPLWLSPEQLRIISVNQEESTAKFIDELEAKARKLKIRTFVDNSNESVGKKIRNAEIIKAPYSVVVGAKEIETGMLKPRIRDDMKSSENEPTFSIDDFLNLLTKEVQEKLSKSTI